MNKEELLKIYSAYLPHDLFVKSFNIFTGDPVFILGLEDNPKNNIAGIEWIINEGFVNFKPVLFDLSYLTKEIEHKGERFIPIEQLAKIHINWNEFDYDLKVEAKVKRQFNLVIRWKIRNKNDDFYSDDLFIMIEKWQHNKYWIIQKLLEWHFNIFGLSTDQFINKATLQPCQKKE